MMKAIVYRGPNDLRLESIPVPQVRSGELLVKVAVCGVCPTDIKKIRYGTVPPPRVFGHETAGVIVKVGKTVRRTTGQGGDFRVGDRVSLHHHVPCLRCHFCRHRAFAQCAGYKKTGITAGFEPAGGGYAEYVRVMPRVLPGVVKIPAGNTFEEGAMLEPVNTVLKAIKRLNLLSGDRVLVAGQGPIGLMFTKILSLRGIRVAATDLMENRVRLALEWGAEKSFNAGHKDVASQIRSAYPVLDAAIITVPSASVVLEAVGLVRGSAQILLFAHTRKGEEAAVDLGSICLEEKDLIGSYSADFTLQREVARLVFSRKLDVRELITHRFPLDQTAAAVALASHPTADSLKVIVNQ
ncbi:MAG TPA: alcohol dehydrogenase catalytic domain-containing protein [Candidatus Baltobacteraceae bacterium]|nr:alcohol dehydrogenase catalytic domain-containing protein [Candidatus Baltobacteraceae bacterium]